MKGVIKTLVYALVAVVTVVGAWFFEQSFAVVQEEQPDVPEHGVLRFDEATLPEFEKIFQSGEEYAFALHQGRMWGNFEISASRVNIVAGEVVLIPQRAQFMVHFTGKNLELSVFDGDVYLGFLEPGVTLDTYQDQYGRLFRNTLLVPRGTSVSIPLDKLTRHLDYLLYTKLVKEFKYSALSSALLEDEWVKENRVQDRVFLERTIQQISSEIFDLGAQDRDSLLHEAWFYAEEWLSVIPKKERQVYFRHLFEYLDDALFYYNSGDEESGYPRLQAFFAYRAHAPSGMARGEFYYAQLDEYINLLSLFGPSDRQYSLLKALLERNFDEGHQRYEVLERFWGDVYDALSIDASASEQALNVYYEHLVAMLEAPQDDVLKYRDFLRYQNQLLDTILLRHPLFYKDGYFAMKHVVEKELTATYQDGRLKEELAQAFISTKIDFLKRLRKYFFEEKVDTVQARRILSRLVKEIDQLMPSDGAELGVVGLFEDQLKDIGNFWGYLNSREYHNSAIYGATHEERYAFYLEEKDRIWSFVNLQEEVLGQPVVKKTALSEVKKEILSVFEGYGDISSVEVVKIEDISQRFVPVKGIAGGYPFSAEYDREYDTLKKVYVYDELVSDRSVKVASLTSLLQKKFSGVKPAGTQEELTVETNAEIIARIFIAAQVAKAGFEATMEQVSVVDKKNAVYRVSEVGLPGAKEVTVSFDYLASSEKVQNLFVKTLGVPTVLEGAYTLEEVYALLSFEAAPESGGKVLR